MKMHKTRTRIKVTNLTSNKLQDVNDKKSTATFDMDLTLSLLFFFILLLGE